jgi:hypothetical protein
MLENFLLLFNFSIKKIVGARKLMTFSRRRRKQSDCLKIIEIIYILSYKQLIFLIKKLEN